MLFFGRESEVVRELDPAVEVLATASGIKMSGGGVIQMAVFKTIIGAFRMIRRTHAEMARHGMARCAVMETHVPAHRNEQHRNGKK